MILETSSELARFNMIQQQIRPWDVLDDRVLDAMASLPREMFVPDAWRGLAYADIEIPIGAGAVMLAPRVAARMLQALAVRPGERALLIGVGTGYVSAGLSRLGARVTGIEIDPDLAEQARARLADLGDGAGPGTVEIRVGDGLAGPAAESPFDLLALTGSLPTPGLLPMLRTQLTLGGRLFCIQGEAPAMRARLIRRLGHADFAETTLFETCVPALTNAPRPDPFTF